MPAANAKCSDKLPGAGALSRGSVSSDIEALTRYIRKYNSALVALSGGLDSAVTLWASIQALGADNTRAVTSRSASLPSADYADIPVILAQCGLAAERHTFIETDELANPLYAANNADRCYHCKTELYGDLERMRELFGVDVVFDGCNLSDVGDFRPGRKAAEERGVVSPLLACKLTKDKVREIALVAGLTVANKPASACLSSRAPHGTPITAELLKSIDCAERALGALGFSGHRVRYHHSVARIEFQPNQIERALGAGMREKIVRAVKSAGFRFVTVDLEGYRAGSLNARNNPIESE